MPSSADPIAIRRSRTIPVELLERKPVDARGTHRQVLIAGHHLSSLQFTGRPLIVCRSQPVAEPLPSEGVNASRALPDLSSANFLPELAALSNPVFAGPIPSLLEQLRELLANHVAFLSGLFGNSGESAHLRQLLTDELQPRPNRETHRHTQKVPASIGVALENRQWLTVKEAAHLYPFTEGALRHLIFMASAYLKNPKKGLRSNGFERCLFRPPGQRRVLLSRAALDEWISSSLIARSSPNAPNA